MSTTEEQIKKQLAENPVIVYMKGTPERPECGFSANAVAALKATGVPFSYVNVLQAPFIYERLPSVSEFPTFPQIFIQGELIGGSDIAQDMLASGELTRMMQAATA
jgi:monothiol glutaredoxin